jgi:dienelactone hydrolase
MRYDGNSAGIRKEIVMSIRLFHAIGTAIALAAFTGSLQGCADATDDGSSDENGGAGGTTGGAGGGGAGGAGSGGDLQEATGCDGASLLALPEDPATAGPWAVGVRTVTLGDLTMEVWYPAPPGSDEGATAATYDVRDWLPAGEEAKISDEKHGPPQGQGGFLDLPVDDQHGPYPVVIHIHGTAAFRVASAEQTVHWASRGFVVVAADHPGMYLGDMLASVSSGACQGRGIPQDLNRDIDQMIAALNAPSGDLAFLDGVLDMNRLGIAGHSQGAGAAADMTTKPNVRIVLPLAVNSPAIPSSTLESVLILSGRADTVIAYAQDQAAYQGSPAPKRLVGIENTGHLAMTVLCGLRNPEGQDLVQVGQEVGVCGMSLASFLWDCSPTYLEQGYGAEIINYATAAALEETLHCADRSAAFASLTSTYPEVTEFLEDLGE